jgi:uncharacterized protein (TIGR03067 family)
MRRAISALFVLTTPLLLAADTDDAVRKELKALEGTWKTVGVEAAGQAFPKDQILDFTIVVAADGKSTGKTPQGEFRYTMTVNPAKKPKTIDNLHETGPDKGKKQHGIYKLEGDEWTVCMTPPGAAEGDRPKDFATKDSANVVFVFERVTEDKKP